MKVYFASDHAGFALKNELIEYVHTLGHETEDLGAHTLDPEDDYPDFITPIALRVAAEDHPPAGGARGVIVGGSGQGEAMAANRVGGIRAAVFYTPAHVGLPMSHIKNGVNERENEDVVRLAREHNNANILSIGARFVTIKEAQAAVERFIETPFSEAPRHIRRLAKF